MSMISGKLGEDKQNKQEKSETAVRESIGVVPLALPLMAGPGAISSTIVWGTRYHSISYLFGFFVAIALFALCCWGLFRMAPWLVRVLRQTGINVITRIMGLLLMALGIEFIVTGIKGFSPACLINSFQMKRSCHAPFTSSLFFYFVPAQLSKAKGIGKNILLKLQLVIRISLTASPHHHVIFSPHHNPGLAEE